MIKKYDIVYSVTAHENPAALVNMYTNIVRFNKGLNVLAIFHCSIKLYKDMRVFGTPETPTLMFHPAPTDKARFSCTLFLAHLENYRHLEEQGIEYDYFCTLASNCLFVRPVSLDDIRDSTPELNIGATGYTLGDEDRWQASEFKKNPAVLNVFQSLDIEVVTNIHEGAYFKKEVFGSIAHICHKQEINRAAFVCDTLAAEEVILPSLEKYCTGVVSKRYAVWIPGITLEDVKSIAETGGCKSTVTSNYNIVKVPRDMEDEKRKYIVQQMPYERPL